MGAGAEGKVRHCASKWEWKLKSKLENEEGGPRSSQQQQREPERGKGRGSRLGKKQANNKQQAKLN